MINYTPFGHSDWQTIVSDIKKFGSAGKKTAVVSTINGDANVPSTRNWPTRGIKAKIFRSSPSPWVKKSLPGLVILHRWLATLPPELLPVRRCARQCRVHQDLACLHTRTNKRVTQRPDGSRLYRLQRLGEGP